ncbi:MAG: tetratricopeptide repeat protein [Magnetococcales bacterium]|nr:tetratricopeptide repeat protein [Magnetococcales bacterium]
MNAMTHDVLPLASPDPSFSPDRRGDRHLHWAIFWVFLTAILPFFQARAFDFITMDDPSYVYDNPFVRAGVTWEGVRWAISSTHHGWLPLTRLSLMLDVTLFGVNPGAMHLVNLFFHVCNALLILLLLYRATGNLWAGACTAALFAVHPLRVESVVWISERKDVLFAFFILLALYAYQEARQRRDWQRLLPTLFLFVAAGMAKPMAVTLPVMLLLWDYWPLHRFPAEWRRLLLEKIPFFVLATLLAGTTLWIAHDLDNVSSLGQFSLTDRLANTVISYGVYGLQTLWPVDLDFFYPHPLSHWRGGHLLLAAAFLIVMTLYAVHQRHRAPYLLFGWLWFLLTLLPVIGILQASAMVRADRFTYIPHLGLGVALTWEAQRLLRHRRAGVPVLAGLALLGTALLGYNTWLQAQQWRNTEVLATRSLEISGPNFINLRILGLAHASQGDWEKASERFQQSLQFSPHDPVSQRTAADALIHLQRHQEALELLQKATRDKPDDPKNHMMVGAVLLQLNRTDEAKQAFERAFPLHTNPDQLMDQAGIHFAFKNLPQEATPYFRRAQALNPNSFPVNMHLGISLENDPASALPFFVQAVRLQPRHVAALFQLGKMHNRLKDHTQASDVLRRALEIQPLDPNIHYELAYALLKSGVRSAAIDHLQEALRLKPDHTPARQLLAVAQTVTP